MPRTVLFALVLGLPLLASPARAGERVLRRAPQADRLVQLQPASELRELATVAPACTAAALKGRDLTGARCRILLLRQAAARLDVSVADEKARAKALRRRSELATAALEQGQAVADFSPVNKLEGVERQRFEAKALSCQAAGELYDALSALPAGHPSATALQPLAGQPPPLDTTPMKSVVCGCASAAVDLAGAAFVPPSDPLHNETQRALYTRGCFLDVEAGRSSLVDIKRDAPGAGPASLPGHAAAADRGGEVRRVAASREFQLSHCKERVAQRRQRAIDREGLERCVCEVVGKWRFAPSEATTSPVEVDLVPDQVRYLLTLGADGKVGACRVVLVDKKD